MIRNVETTAFLFSKRYQCLHFHLNGYVTPKEVSASTVSQDEALCFSPTRFVDAGNDHLAPFCSQPAKPRLDRSLLRPSRLR